MEPGDATAPGSKQLTAVQPRVFAAKATGRGVKAEAAGLRGRATARVTRKTAEKLEEGRGTRAGAGGKRLRAGRQRKGGARRVLTLRGSLEEGHNYWQGGKQPQSGKGLTAASQALQRQVWQPALRHKRRGHVLASPVRR